MPNQLAILPHAGLFLGRFADNAMHKHYALQLTMSLGGAFRVRFEDGTSIETQAICIGQQVAHHIELVDSPLLLILIDPVSRLGLALKQYLNEEPYTDQIPSQQILADLATKWHAGKLDQQQLTENFHNYSRIVVHSYPQLADALDDRISKVLDLIENDPSQVRQLNEIAQQVHLSPDRFRHLFRQQTGITFTRMQLWYKLLAAFKLIGDRPNLSEIAHSAGFADSAHLSRTFKETFGLTPVQLLKNSRSVQA